MSFVTAACEAAPRRVHERPPPVAVDPAERAADALRDRMITLDAEGCARDGEALVRQFPDSGRLRAWWIGCVARAGRVFEAEALADVMLAEKPGDDWARLARVLAWLGASPVTRSEVLTESAALLERLPVRRDALVARAWALIHLRQKELLAFAAAEPDAPATARVVGLLATARAEPPRLPEALAIAHSVAPEDPEFVAVAHAAASWLAVLDRPVEALAWAEAGLTRAPHAASLLRQRWALMPKQPGADAAAREAVLEDIQAEVDAAADRPAVLLAAADSLRALGEAGRAAPIEARILAEFAASPHAEAVLYRRLEPAQPQAGVPADAEALALRRTMLEAYLARPRHHEPLRREHVARWRFDAVVADPAASPEAIGEAIDVMLAHRRLDLSAHVEAARVLGERTPDTARAVALAHEGVAAVEAFVAGWRAAGSERIDMLRRDYLSVLHAILGGLYVKTGRLDDASAALRRAETLALVPFAELQLSLAELARRRGDLDAAELHLAEGIDLPGEHGDRWRRALEALYRERTGSLRGLSRHLEEITAAGRARRKAEILAGYAADAAPVPDFSLPRIDGRTVTLASLRGKITVVHFWYASCGGCLLELPEFDAFAAAHAGDPDVAIVGLHNGGSVREVADWVRSRGLHFDVLVDDSYAGRVGVDSFPTTWFLDQEGRVRFTTAMGLTRRLREELDWRIDALRERAGSRVPSGAAAG